jgi:hypothetical protein
VGLDTESSDGGKAAEVVQASSGDPSSGGLYTSPTEALKTVSDYYVYWSGKLTVSNEPRCGMPGRPALRITGRRADVGPPSSLANKRTRLGDRPADRHTHLRTVPASRRGQARTIAATFNISSLGARLQNRLTNI